MDAIFVNKGGGLIKQEASSILQYLEVQLDQRVAKSIVGYVMPQLAQSLNVPKSTGPKESVMLVVVPPRY